MPCHLIFAGEDIDVQNRNLIVSLSNVQLITTIKIMEEDAKEVAEQRMWKSQKVLLLNTNLVVML